MGRYDKYEAGVGRAQGGNVQYIRNTAYFDVGDVRGGDNGTQVTGRNIQLDILSRGTQTFLTLSTNSVLAVYSTITPAYGYVHFEQAAGTGGCSIALPGASTGAAIVLNFKGIQSNLQVKASGVSLVGFRGSDLSRLSVVNGSATSQVVKLVCFTDDCWSVVDYANIAVDAIEAPSS